MNSLSRTPRSAVALAVAVVVVALMIVPALAAAGTTHQLTQGAVSHRHLSCTHTGVTGPTGSVTAQIVVLKGRHPAAAALACGRATAVLRAGKGDMYGKLLSSEGRTVTVAGTRYTVTAFLAEGASGPAPAFVGGGTAVIAIYASGR